MQDLPELAKYLFKVSKYQGGYDSLHFSVVELHLQVSSSTGMCVAISAVM